MASRLCGGKHLAADLLASMLRWQSGFWATHRACHRWFSQHAW